MTIKIDEEKIKPELIFNQQGVEIYRYDQPLYLYFYNEKDFSVYKTRVARSKTNHKLYKASCFYRIRLSDYIINELKKANCVTQWNEKYVEVSNKKTFSWQLESLIGFKADHITDWRARYSMEFDNVIKEPHNTVDELFFKDEDIKEITTVNTKEKKLQKEKAKQTLLEQLFGKQIEQIAEQNKMHVATWITDKKSIFLPDSAIQSFIDEHLKSIVEQFEGYGLKATVYNKRSYKVKLEIPMVRIELGDDIEKGDDNEGTD